MNIVYIQDQEVACYKGEYYHSKSEHFFERYLAGLTADDTLTVYCGVVPIDNAGRVSKYKNVSHPRIKYVQIPEFRKLGNLVSIFKQIKEVVKTADFCYLRCGIASSFAGYYCRKQGVPYMAIVNEDVFRNLWNHPNKVFKLFAYPLGTMTSKMVKNAQYACYVTKEYLEKRYPCKGEMLGCSDIEFLDINQNALDSRINKINTRKETIVLGSIGSLSAKLKGQDTVLYALAELKKAGKNNYRYQLVGGGSSDNLRALASRLGVIDQVDFMGEYSHDAVLQWFDGIDIYVHPSHSEGLPRTILEAMTKATPCICSNVGGIPELINKEWLFAYNGNEVNDLVNLILKMDSPQMQKEAEANFEKSKEYNPEILEKRRSTFFTHAIDNVRNQK